MAEKQKRMSYFTGNLKTREDAGAPPMIEGYFSVFDQETELWPGVFESIARGAFSSSLQNNDIRCLFNHDSANVLGRMSAGTLQLWEDSHGLYGSLLINPDDRMAMDVYARVKRGDITGCSFGFYPISERWEDRDDGTHYVVEEADTIEVTICTFPAYPQTEIDARMAGNNRRRRDVQKKRLEEFKQCLHN